MNALRPAPIFLSAWLLRLKGMRPDVQATPRFDAFSRVYWWRFSRRFPQVSEQNTNGPNRKPFSGKGFFNNNVRVFRLRTERNKEVRWQSWTANMHYADRTYHQLLNSSLWIKEQRRKRIGNCKKLPCKSGIIKTKFLVVIVSDLEQISPLLWESMFYWRVEIIVLLVKS